MGSGGDSIARVLLYDVTQMITYGDLYDDNPRQLSEYRGLFSQASEQLVVSGNVFAQIQDVVDEEVDLLDKKKVIFWADTPYVPPLIGDLNRNGKVDILDFGIFSDFFGEPNTIADLDGSGFVDVLDFGIFASQFGALTVTPEPTSFFFLSTGDAILLCRRRSAQ